MAERRGRGEGSLTYDQEAGRWTGRLDLGRGVAGSRVRVKVVGATRAEARRKLLELRRQHEAGVDVAARGTTFAEVAELWLARGLKAGTAPTTRESYEGMIRLHLNPALGHRPVAQIRP